MRDDAKTATQQTTVLDLDVSPMPIAETGNARGHVDHAEAAKQIRQFAELGNTLT